MIQSKIKLNGLCISPIFQIRGLHINNQHFTSRCIPMSPSTFAIPFFLFCFISTVSFSHHYSLVHKHIFPDQLSPGFTYFFSVTKKMVFSFLLEESNTSKAGISVRVSLSPCVGCVISLSPHSVVLGFLLLQTCTSQPSLAPGEGLCA